MATRVAGLLREAISKTPGLTDKQLAEALFGRGAPQQRVNAVCRGLASEGQTHRHKRQDGLIGNFPNAESVETTPQTRATTRPETDDPLSEDAVKGAIATWLGGNGWHIGAIAWGRTRGVDIRAARDGTFWLIEVKGRGSRSAMRVNYFLGALGELLQRMDDPHARYSVAFPDLPQYRGLWARLPSLAKTRLNPSALFVDEFGTVEES